MEFLDALNRGKVLIADGDMGTILQLKGINPHRCRELWNLEKPEIIVDVHREYIKAGASIICCNSSGCSREKLSLYHMEDYQERIITAAIFNGLKAAGERAFVAYSMGPTGQMYKNFLWYYKQFEEQIRIVNKYPVDLVLIETMYSLQEARAALLAARENCLLPVVCTITIEEDGRTLTGTPPGVACTVLESLGADAVGINCNTPEEMLKWISTVKPLIHIPLMVRPDCGNQLYPEGIPLYGLDPDTFMTWCEKLYSSGAAVIGGCCGTTPLHIEKLASRLKHLPVVKGEIDDNCIITVEKYALQFPAIQKGIIEGRPELALRWLEENAHIDYNSVITHGVIPALNRLQELYNEGKLFLPQLITACRVAGDICRIINSSNVKMGDPSWIKIILAAVEGELHDIGKNIVKLFLESFGYRVYDLGRSVSALEIAQAIENCGAKLVYLSTLMTTTLPAMEHTVRLITQKFPDCIVAVGGAAVDPDFAERIGAHYYCKDGMHAVKIAEEVFPVK